MRTEKHCPGCDKVLPAKGFYVYNNKFSSRCKRCYYRQARVRELRKREQERLHKEANQHQNFDSPTYILRAKHFGK